MSLSNREILDLFAETCYEMGLYATEAQPNLIEVMASRNAIRKEILARLGAAEEDGEDAHKEYLEEDMKVFLPERIHQEPITDKDVLLGIVPAIYRLASYFYKQRVPRRAQVFSVIQILNAALRPYGWEYMLRPGTIVTLRHPLKKYTFTDELR